MNSLLQTLKTALRFENNLCKPCVYIRLCKKMLHFPLVKQRQTSLISLICLSRPPTISYVESGTFSTIIKLTRGSTWWNNNTKINISPDWAMLRHFTIFWQWAKWWLANYVWKKRKEMFLDTTVSIYSVNSVYMWISFTIFVCSEISCKYILWEKKNIFRFQTLLGNILWSV